MIQIDSATGGPYEALGDLIKQQRVEDSERLRLALIFAMAINNYGAFKYLLNVTHDQYQQTRQLFIQAWGEPDS